MSTKALHCGVEPTVWRETNVVSAQQPPFDRKGGGAGLGYKTHMAVQKTKNTPQKKFFTSLQKIFECVDI